MTTVQRTIETLQQQLGLTVKTGQITLNLREGRFESFETKTYCRIIAKSLDSPMRVTEDIR